MKKKKLKNIIFNENFNENNYEIIDDPIVNKFKEDLIKIFNNENVQKIKPFITKGWIKKYSTQ